MKLVSILAGIAFVIAVALIVRAAERHDARRARASGTKNRDATRSTSAVNCEAVRAYS